MGANASSQLDIADLWRPYAQRAVLSRTSFIGANADWAETWYSDYARGPSAYGGKPGKVHKLHSRVVRNAGSQEEALRQVVEPRVQLGFMLVNVNLVETTPAAPPVAAPALDLAGTSAAAAGHVAEASSVVDGRERVADGAPEGTGAEDASARASGAGPAGARAGKDARTWSSLELAFPLHDSLDVVCTVSRVLVGAGGMLNSNAEMSAAGGHRTAEVQEYGLGVPGAASVSEGADGVIVVVGWRAEEKYAKKLALLNLQGDLEGGKDKESAKETMSKKLRLVENVAARLKVAA